ncbi:DUF1569 domain-containing protein [Pirellulaceae bacterium SH449]
MVTRQNDLKFSSLEEVDSYIRKLERDGYVSNGNWNLGQICEHLRDWMLYPIHGFPKSGVLIGAVLFCMRKTVGKRMFHAVSTTQRMKPSQPTIPVTVHKNDIAESQAVERLANAIRELKDFRGELHPSPLFGKLTHAEYVSLHLAHCAHHLSFLTPRTP